ncbi:MAG: hypothetical protein PHU21_06880, partial [Elusimicrobia bacterium]|nr:hypothetical protein [Elusimicrobiota bacterium]
GRSFAARLPASTGIGARGESGDCVMDLLAVRPGPRACDRVRRSARQGLALRYGSAFARALVLRDGPRRTVHVSGTASIDASGASVGLGDPGLQSRNTVVNVAAALAEGGAGLKDIAAAVLYCKDRRACEAFLRVSRLPAIPVLADVCRPELEVELEAVAVRG